MADTTLDGKKIVSSIGMTVALISLAMLFATLMMGFAVYRFTTPIWPPQGIQKPSLLLPSFSTLSIFFSSMAFSRRRFFLALFLGLMFMSFQFLFWRTLKSQGIFSTSGIFGSIIYSFTWIHAAHIIAGLCLLVWLIVKTKHPMSGLENTISNVGKFWHFLGIIWAIMFVTIFVL